MDEAITNAIEHGNKWDAKKEVSIRVSLIDSMLLITVTDEGEGFKPEALPDPTIQENLEALNGRGVFLMSQLADEIKFSKKGNSVIMRFKNIIY